MPVWRRFQNLPLLARILLFAALLLGVLSLNWQAAPPPGLPKVVSEGHATGELRAGAARQPIAPPFDVLIAGLDARPTEPSTGVLDPPAVRALTVESGGKRIALVSLELVLIPASLRDRILAGVADLKLDELFVGATHTHAGPGAFWKSKAASWVEVGSFDPRMEDFLVAQTTRALRDAASALRPARFSFAAVEAAHFASNRNDPKAALENRLTVARFLAPDGSSVGNVVIYAVHPTILPPDDNRLSGDWPGALSGVFERDGGPTTLVFQGAGGDVTWAKRRGEISRQDRILLFGAELASEAKGVLGAAGEGSPTAALDWARVIVPLPEYELGAVPAPFTRAVSNVFARVAGTTTTTVSFLRLGNLKLFLVPGELVAHLGETWSRELEATPVSLTDDFVGAIEAPTAVEEGRGEAPHSWFGPTLAPDIRAALVMARDAAVGPRKPSAP